MTDIGYNFANVLDISSDVSDASSCTKIVDIKMPNISLLGVNQPIENLTIISGSPNYSGDSIEDGNKPSSSHPGKNTSDSASPVIMNTYDFEPPRDEAETRLFINSFRYANG